MKLSLSIALAAGLLILTRSIILAETFAESVRVSPETATLKPGEYVSEPERVPQGPLLIVASVTERGISPPRIDSLQVWSNKPGRQLRQLNWSQRRMLTC